MSHVITIIEVVAILAAASICCVPLGWIARWMENEGKGEE